jgi:PAS domain S-box-containing protein
MTVKNKLRLAGLILILFAVVMPLTYFFTALPAVDQANKLEVLGDFNKGVFEVVLAQNVLLEEPSRRALEHWKESYVTLGTLFDVPNDWSEEEQLQLNFIRSDYNALGSFVGQVVQESDSGVSIVLKERDSQKLLLLPQALIDRSAGLEDTMRSKLRHHIYDAIPALIVLSGSIFLVGVGLVVLFQRDIAQPLTGLTKVALLFSEGDLEKHVPLNLRQRKDELGQLANTFEVMAKKLLATYGSLEAKVQRGIGKVVEAETRHEAILQSLGEGLIITDVLGRVAGVNPAAEKLLDIKEDELRGNSFVKEISLCAEDGTLIPMENHPALMAVERGRAISKLVWLKRGAGLFPVQLTATPILQQEKPVGIVVVFRDMTREQEIDKAKSEFVSLASHQLRTPLSAINWYAEMLKAGDAGKLTPEQEQYIDEIYSGNQRMVELVNALLDVSRIELGTFSVEPENVNVTQLAKDIVKEQEPEVFKKKQKLTEHYGDDIPLMRLDPKLMKIVLQNLLSNAIKYTPEMGTIDLTIDAGHGKLSMSVADTGLGIPKDQQDKIFTKLFRADNVKESDATGTGLGLYLAQSIIEHSGGKIWFESVENEGTTFYVELPLTGMKVKKGSKRLGE